MGSFIVSFKCPVCGDWIHFRYEQTPKNIHKKHKKFVCDECLKKKEDGDDQVNCTITTLIEWEGAELFARTKGPYFQTINLINSKKEPLSLQTWCWKIVEVHKLDTTCLPKWLNKIKTNIFAIQV